MRLAPGLARLAGQLDELRLAVTSRTQAEALHRVLEAARLTLPVMMAVDSGLGREGARDLEAAVALAGFIRSCPRFALAGLYTHEGHAYSRGVADIARLARAVWQTLTEARQACGGALEIWPGCTVTARLLAALPGVDAIRPGAYAFGDLLLSRATGAMGLDQVALTVLATVIDQPRPGLALIDAGSKTFSSDRLPSGEYAAAANGSAITVARVSEEHGFLEGEAVERLRVGDRLRLIPAHVCPAVNLANEAFLVDGETVIERWPVDARGCCQ